MIRDILLRGEKTMKNEKASQEAPVRVRWDLVMVRSRKERGEVFPLIAAKYPDVDLNTLIDAAREQSMALRNLNIHRAFGGDPDESSASYHECRVYVAFEDVEFPVHHLMTADQARRLFAQEKKALALKTELDRRAQANRGLKVVRGGGQTRLRQASRPESILKVLSFRPGFLRSVFQQPQALR